MQSMTTETEIIFTENLDGPVEGRYRQELRFLFEYIEFLGISVLKDEEPLTVAQIYVSLPFSQRPVLLGEKRYQRFNIVDAFQKTPHIVVLGDPGAGKSTLVRLLVQSFARSESTPLSSAFGSRLPIPIILRDYAVSQWDDPEDMVSAYLKHLPPSAKEGVTVEWIMAAIEQGRALILLDGLDEVGSKDKRYRLIEKIIKPLLKIARDSLVVITSRVVGYEESPIHHPSMTLELSHWYLAPFGAEEIDEFIRRWYSARERDERTRQQLMQTLRTAIRRSERIRRLAGNPSLLTMMALINRVQANLPSGRAKLYGKIVETYLETLDRYRGLEGYGASVEDMTRWLARVGWEVQERREQDKGDEIVVNESEVHTWLAQAMRESRPHPEAEAANFLDYVRRRSGLLIERGPGKYAFVHLSFQEYFAALHLFSFLWERDTLFQMCIERVGRRSWHETLILLFELLKTNFPAACEALRQHFERNLASTQDAILLGELFLGLLDDDDSGIAVEPALDYVVEVACETGMLLSDLYARNKSLPVMPRIHEQINNTPHLQGMTAYKIAYFFGSDRAVCDWAVSCSKLPTPDWLKPIRAHYHVAPSLIEVLRNPLVEIPTSHRGRYLLALGNIHEVSYDLLIPLIIFALNLNTNRAKDMVYAQDLISLFNRTSKRFRFLDDIYLDYFRISKQGAIIALLESLKDSLEVSLEYATKGRRSTTKARYRDRLLEDNFSSAVTLAHFVAQNMSMEIQSSVVRMTNSYESSSLPDKDGTDDWTRLKILTAQLASGAGTPEICDERNGLLDYFLAMPEVATFPGEYADVVDRSELRKIIRIIFLHEHNSPIFQPDWFKSGHVYATLLRTNPRDLSSLLADVIAPHQQKHLPGLNLEYEDIQVI